MDLRRSADAFRRMMAHGEITPVNARRLEEECRNYVLEGKEEALPRFFSILEEAYGFESGALYGATQIRMATGEIYKGKKVFRNPIGVQDVLPILVMLSHQTPNEESRKILETAYESIFNEGRSKELF